MSLEDIRARARMIELNEAEEAVARTWNDPAWGDRR